MGTRKPRIVVINGPMLNLLGTRQPKIFGNKTLEQLNDALDERATELGVEVECVQNNHEGELVEAIIQAPGKFDGMIINAAGYSWTSIVIRDALQMTKMPIIEVFFTNNLKREEFRHKSIMTEVCLGKILGLGEMGYRLALQALAELLTNRDEAAAMPQYP